MTETEKNRVWSILLDLENAKTALDNFDFKRVEINLQTAYNRLQTLVSVGAF